MKTTVLLNAGFHARKNISENYPQFRHAPSEIFASLVIGRKFLSGIVLKGR